MTFHKTKRFLNCSSKTIYIFSEVIKVKDISTYYWDCLSVCNVCRYV